MQVVIMGAGLIIFIVLQNGYLPCRAGPGHRRLVMTLRRRTPYSSGWLRAGGSHCGGEPSVPEGHGSGETLSGSRRAFQLCVYVCLTS